MFPGGSGTARWQATRREENRPRATEFGPRREAGPVRRPMRNLRSLPWPFFVLVRGKRCVLCESLYRQAPRPTGVRAAQRYPVYYLSAAAGRRGGTDTTASPSSTSLPSTRASQASRTTRPFGVSSTTSTVTSTTSPILTGPWKFKRLRPVDRAGARQLRAEHRRDQARGVEPVGDALAEARFRRIDVAQMQRIVVAREPREADHVGIHDGLHQAFAHADMQVLETEDPQHAGIDDRLGALLRHGRILDQVLTPANAVLIRDAIGPWSCGCPAGRPPGVPRAGNTRKSLRLTGCSTAVARFPRSGGAGVGTPSNRRA